MKTLATIIFSWLMISGSLFAQIQITSSDMSNTLAVGKAWYEYNSDSLITTMNVGNASGNSQAWTVPNISYHDTTIRINISPSKTPYANLFPTATHSQYWYYHSPLGYIDTEYVYYKITMDTWLTLGRVSHIVANEFDTTITQTENSIVAIFPVHYGETYVSKRDSIGLGGGSYKIITDTVYWDAFGTITFPNGTFNALREISATRTNVYSNDSLTSSSVTHNFQWITKNNGGFYGEIDTSLQTSGNITLHAATLDLLENYTTAIRENTSNSPKDYQIFQNYPNPFNPTTVISYQLSVPSRVNINVYDILGKEVTKLVKGVKPAGNYSFQFNGNALSSGVYFYSITASPISGKTKSYYQVRKMILLK